MPIEPGIEDRYLRSDEDRQDLGKAYTAYDLQVHRLVNLLEVDECWGSGQEALNRLRMVQQSVATLSAPGLIPYEHTGLVDGQVYLVHTQIEGQTLAELLARNGRLDAETAVGITIQLCEALDPVHQAGLTHGSLSPHCVVLKEPAAAADPSAAEILVLDTGLLPALRPTDTPEQEMWGRLPYISPEQASGQEVQPASDVYVIGALLYEMLRGRPPFRLSDKETLKYQLQNQVPLQLVDPNIPQALAEIVQSALAKEPTARYRNAGQLAQTLRAQVGPPPPKESLSVPAPPVPPVSPAPPAGDTRFSTDLHDVERAGAWEPEQEGVDWLMIALLVIALIAVLGLIPLWRAVYDRYVTTPADSSLVPHRLEADLAPILLGDNYRGCQPERGAELDEWVVVWYNTMPSRPSLAHLLTKSMHARHLSGCREKTPSLGVQLTGQGDKV